MNPIDTRLRELHQELLGGIDSTTISTSTSSSTTRHEFFDALQTCSALERLVKEIGKSGTVQDQISPMASLCSEHEQYNLLGIISGSISYSAQVPPDIRTALCGSLQAAVETFDASILKSYSRKIIESCLQFLHSDEAARADMMYILTLQTLLERTDVSLSLDAKQLADSFNRTYFSGKKAPGVRGEILSAWGKLCHRFQSVFSQPKNDRDQETRGAELRRVCKYAINQELTVKNKRENAIVSGGLEAIRFACFSTPPLANSPDASEIFNLAIKSIELTVELSRFEVPLQAIHLLRCHLGLFSKQILEDPVKYFNMCRHLANLKHDKLIKPAIALGTSILDLVSRALEGGNNNNNNNTNSNSDTISMDIVNTSTKDDDNEDDDIITTQETHRVMDSVFSQSQLDVEGIGFTSSTTSNDDEHQQQQSSTTNNNNKNQPTLSDLVGPMERRSTILNQFLTIFRDAMSAPPVKRSDDKDARDKFKRDVEFAIQGYGLFAGAIMSIMKREIGQKLLNDILQALFKCSAAFDEEDSKQHQQTSTSSETASSSSSYSHMDKHNPIVSRHGKLMCTYARILCKMPPVSSKILNDPTIQTINNILLEEVKFLHREWVRAGLYVKGPIAFGISMLFCGSSTSLLHYLLTRLIPDLLARSISRRLPTISYGGNGSGEIILDTLIDPDTGQGSNRLVLSYIEFWRRILEMDFNTVSPTSTMAVDIAQQFLWSKSPTSTTAHVASSNQLSRKTSMVYDALMKEIFKEIEKLNLAVMTTTTTTNGTSMILNADEMEDDDTSIMGDHTTTTTSSTSTSSAIHQSSSSGTTAGGGGGGDGGVVVGMTGANQLLHDPSHIVPVSRKDYMLFYEYTTLVCALFRCRQQDAGRWVDTLLRLCWQKLQDYPMASGFYRLALVGFQVLDEDITILEHDESLEFVVRELIETSLGKSTLYTDEILLRCIHCVLACPRGKLLDEFLVHRKYGGLVQACNEALQLGLSSPVAANIAFEALDRWQLLNVMTEDAYQELGPMLMKHLRGGS
jgi:hypothetical protein